jgi:hypothetical protein
MKNQHTHTHFINAGEQRKKIESETLILLLDDLAVKCAAQKKRGERGERRKAYRNWILRLHKLRELGHATKSIP